MKALLTACTAIACAATQVTWLDGAPSDRASMHGTVTAPSGASASQRTGSRAASAHGASALVAPAAPRSQGS